MLHRPRFSLETLEAAKLGDATALSAIVEQYRPFLLQLARERLEPQLQAKIGNSDIVQLSLAEACQSITTFKGATEPELIAWLKRILLNNLMNVNRYYHAEKRAIDRELSFNDSWSRLSKDLVFVSRDMSPGLNLITREQYASIENALLSLSDEYRLVIVERIEMGNPFHRLDRSLAAVPMPQENSGPERSKQYD